MTPEEYKQKAIEQLNNDLAIGYFMKVSSWWGLSKYPGSHTCLIFSDGTYQVIYTYYKTAPPELDTTPKNGKLDDVIMEKLRVIASTITENKSNLSMDAGYTVSVITNGTRFKHENVKDTYNTVVELISPIWK